MDLHHLVARPDEKCGLSVIVVTWNTRELVLDCLASVTAASAPLTGTEIVVVDNGSSDGTEEAIRERFPTARVIALPANVGFAAGCNAGLREICGRHVLLLNSDARVMPGTLEGCVRFLDRHPDVGIVGPQLLHPDGRRQNSIHNLPIVATELLPKAVFQVLFRRRFPSRRWVGEEPLDVEAVTGAVIFARAEAVRDVGPLPEDYFFFLEETEWCRRARAAGWRVVHLPTTFAIHLSGASSKRRDPALTRIEYHRSLYHFFRVNRGTGWMAIVLSLRLLKSLFYVVALAPPALFGGRGLARWKVRRDVLVWHLRGCPRAVGLADAGAAGRMRQSPVPSG
jgi:GT2 family glycosyltransferase